MNYTFVDTEFTPIDEDMKKIKENGFECPICFQLIENVVETKCGHLFCKKCLKTHLQNKEKCPICRKDVYDEDYHVSSFMDRKIKSIELHCPHKKEGCLFKNEYSLVLEHTNSKCEFAPIKCECGFICKITNIDDHRKINCSFYCIDCIKCEGSIKRKDMESHLSSSCPMTDAKCNNIPCKFNGLRKDVDGHQSKCEYALITCECKDKYIRNKGDEHNETCKVRFINCMFCNEKVRINKMDYHVNECIGIKMDCKRCMESIPVVLIDMHNSSECPMLEINCKYKNIGCGFKSYRKEILSHMDNIDALKHHLSLYDKYFEKKENPYSNKSLIDILDIENDGKWEPAEIIDRKREDGISLIRIKYLNWSESYNEWIDSRSTRVAPFQTYTTNESLHKRKKY